MIPLGLWIAGAVAALGSIGMGLLASGIQDRNWRAAAVGAITFGLALGGLGVAS